MIAATWNLENLFRLGGDAGPENQNVYEAKLDALAATINTLAPDVLGVQEVGQPEALTDLVDRLNGSWVMALSQQFDLRRPIRVGVLARHSMQVVADTADFPTLMRPVQKDDDGGVADRMGRGALAVQVDVDGTDVTVVVVHLKSKLLSYPAAPGRTRFNPRDEQERARYAGFALYRRAAEAVATRGVVDDLLNAMDGDPNLILVGDLNDEPSAATTQILHGPPGSQLGTAGFNRPDQGDATRLWNLSSLIPAETRYSRIYQGQGELIDHILVTHKLVGKITEVHTVIDRPLPSVTDNPNERRDARDSDHAPVVATISL